MNRDMSCRQRERAQHNGHDDVFHLNVGPQNGTLADPGWNSLVRLRLTRMDELDGSSKFS